MADGIGIELANRALNANNYLRAMFNAAAMRVIIVAVNGNNAMPADKPIIMLAQIIADSSGEAVIKIEMPVQC
ncbi:MAG: hypothetical protein WCA63_03420 [Gallionella sp.]